MFNCRRQSDLNFMLYIFFVKCKETINHETCQEIKTFDFSQLLHTPSKTRKKGTVIIMLWFYGCASCCCRWRFWPFNPHQHYFTVLTPPPGKNVCKSHKKIKCFMIWAHLFLQHFPRNFFGGSVYKNGDTLVWNQKMNGKSGGNETFLLTTDLLYE